MKYTPEQVEAMADAYFQDTENVDQCGDMLRAYAATLRQAARVGVPDGDDWAQLKKAMEDWNDGVDTDVPQRTLMRLAGLGLLVAETFEVTKIGMDGLAAGGDSQ